MSALSAVLSCCQPAFDVADNLGRFLVRSVQTRGMVEMKTRNLVEGYFASEFLAICNHCGLSCKTLKIFKKIFAFLKQPLW